MRDRSISGDPGTLGGYLRSGGTPGRRVLHKPAVERHKRHRPGSEKVGEESTEFIIAIKNGVPARTAEEAADLFFHILVALRAADVDLKDVIQELEPRRK